MDRGRGNRGSRGRGNSERGNRGGRRRGGGGGGSPFIPKYPIGAFRIQEALDDPSADLGALVSSPGFKKASEHRLVYWRKQDLRSVQENSSVNAKAFSKSAKGRLLIISTFVFSKRKVTKIVNAKQKY